MRLATVSRVFRYRLGGGTALGMIMWFRIVSENSFIGSEMYAEGRSMATIQMSVKASELANPAPLGLCAFGMTTMLLNLQNIGLYPMNSMILAMAIFYGGSAQIIVGAMEFRRGNTFGTVAFSSYGLFWLTFVGMILLAAEKPIFATNDAGMAAYLVIWGLFTLMLFFSTLKVNRALQFVFMSLTILYFLLVLALAFPPMLPIAGVEGFICGFSAFYLGIAQILNETYKRTVLPIFPVKSD